MCIDAKEAKKIADNAVLNQNAIVINDIANKVFAAAKEGRYRENFEFSYPLLFRWEIIKNYLLALFVLLGVASGSEHQAAGEFIGETDFGFT